MTNEVLQCLETRRSIRSFKPDTVEKDKLDAILKAGTYAASGRNKQAAIIVAVTDPQVCNKIRNSVWIHRAKQEFESAIGKEILVKAGICGDYEGIGHVILGYPDEVPVPRPRSEGRVFYI